MSCELPTSRYSILEPSHEGPKRDTQREAPVPKFNNIKPSLASLYLADTRLRQPEAGSKIRL
jgi:hypothetical protein